MYHFKVFHLSPNFSKKFWKKIQYGRQKSKMAAISGGKYRIRHAPKLWNQNIFLKNSFRFLISVKTSNNLQRGFWISAVFKKLEVWLSAMLRNVSFFDIFGKKWHKTLKILKNTTDIHNPFCKLIDIPLVNKSWKNH